MFDIQPLHTDTLKAEVVAVEDGWVANTAIAALVLDTCSLQPLTHNVWF